MKALRFILMTALAALSVFAGDVSGNWKIILQAPNGQTIEGKLVLKAEGDKLTGTLSGPMGEAQIQDGSVSGNTLTFNVVRNETIYRYKGTVSGNAMKLHVTAGDRENTMSATRE
jgi:hypothetical protein